MGMTIDKAIEILERYFISDHYVQRWELETASRLGIEALKRVKADRILPYPVISDFLPGETK